MPGVTSSLATSYLAADSARAAGELTFNILALVGGIALIVFGARFVRRPGAGTGRRVAGIVMIVFGALLLLGLIASAANAGAGAA